MFVFNSRFLRLVWMIPALIAGIGPALAGASAWDTGMGDRFRLITQGGDPMADGGLKAGVEIRLKPGWKTYWRVPGDAGLPPKFDFSGSTNVARVEVRYPFPVRDSDGYSTSIVYKKHVVFPLIVHPKDPHLPVSLKVSATYGVCEKVCIPETSSAVTVLSGLSDPDAEARALIERFAAGVPRLASGKEALGVRSVTVSGKPGTPEGKLVIRLRLADPEQPVDLFVEGRPDWYFGVPELVSADRTGALYHVAIDALPGETGLAGETLRLTMRNGKTRLERQWRLD